MRRYNTDGQSPRDTPVSLSAYRSIEYMLTGPGPAVFKWLPN